MRRETQCVAWIVVAMALAGMPVRADGAGIATGYLSRGYRLRGYQWDPVMGQRWAVYESAAHPERPLVSELDPEGGNGSPTMPAALPVAAAVAIPVAETVVHSGDAVTLWRQEANVRMQLAAVAEGNAGVGQRVQLRVTWAGVYGSTGWRASGFVRGPGSVEME